MFLLLITSYNYCNNTFHHHLIRMKWNWESHLIKWKQLVSTSFAVINGIIIIWNAINELEILSHLSLNFIWLKPNFILDDTTACPGSHGPWKLTTLTTTLIQQPRWSPGRLGSFNSHLLDLPLLNTNFSNFTFNLFDFTVFLI